MFRKLLKQLQLYSGLYNTKLLLTVQKLLIFMLVFSNNQLYRLVCKEMQYALLTIKEQAIYTFYIVVFTNTNLVNKVVYKVFLSLIQLYKEVVKLFKNNTLNKIIDDLKQYLFFANYIRAFNSIYLLVVIKGGYKKKAP